MSSETRADARTPLTWRVAGLLPLLFLVGGFSAVLIATLRGGAIAMLDFSPLRDPWALAAGADDGVAEAPLFHLLLAGAGWLFGMGLGSLLTVAGCVWLAVAGVWRTAGNRVAGAAAGLAFAGSPFVLARINHGQVAFIGACGLFLLARSAATRDRIVAAGGCWGAAVLFAPHALLIGAPFVLSAVRGWWRRAAVAVGVACVLAPLFVFSSSAESSDESALSVSRFAARYGTAWDAVSGRGFWAGDVRTWTGAVLAGAMVVAAVAVRDRRARWALIGMIAIPAAVAASPGVLSWAIGEFPPIAVLREPHKLVVIAAIGGSWAVGRAVERVRVGVAVVLITVLGACAGLGIHAATSQRIMQPGTVAALERVREQVGDDTIVVLPAQRYAYVSDVSSEVQDVVVRWTGGERMENVAPWSGDAEERAKSAREFAAAGGENDSVFSTGVRWVVALRAADDGLDWLGAHPRLVREHKGSVELYRVLDPAPCSRGCTGVARGVIRERLVANLLAVAVVACSLLVAVVLGVRRRRRGEGTVVP